MTIDEFEAQMAPQHWAAVGEFVRAAVRALEPRDAEKARRYLRSTSKFALWAWSKGMSLNRAAIFTEATVNRFMEQGFDSPSVASRHHVRQQLLHIVSLETGVRYRQRIESRPREPLRPITPKTSASYSSWAATQSTAQRRINAHALLGLAEGAGLKVSEILECRVSDVLVDSDGMVVTVRGDAPRQIPVVQASVSTLKVALENRAPSEHVFIGKRSPNNSGYLVSNFDSTGPERPMAIQLRATWIVERLNDNVPIALLLHMAGLKDASAIRPYLPFVAMPKESDWRSLLSGRTS